MSPLYIYLFILVVKLQGATAEGLKSRGFEPCSVLCDCLDASTNKATLQGTPLIGSWSHVTRPWFSRGAGNTSDWLMGAT